MAKACLPGISKINTHISTTKAYGFLAIGTRLCVAGFDPKRLRKFWDHHRIIKEIRGMRDRNLPLYASYVMKNHANLFSDALVCSLALRPLHLFAMFGSLALQWDALIHHRQTAVRHALDCPSRDLLIGSRSNKSGSGLSWTQR